MSGKQNVLFSGEYLCGIKEGNTQKIETEKSVAEVNRYEQRLGHWLY